MPLDDPSGTAYRLGIEYDEAEAGVTWEASDGSIRRCHFIREEIGNIYLGDLREVLRERPCSNRTCGCHIGYVHMDHLKLYEIYGDGVLERIPKG
ncbi:MAG TPA: hypothetical protein VLB68_16725 [Pyrinomonadaceae bacterium]|nr:hypothetical protein [Pyrinomonadaceae bacterium]